MSEIAKIGVLLMISLSTLGDVSAPSPLPDRVLYNFEQGKPLELRENGTQARLERRRAPQGKQALYVEFSQTEWPNITFHAGATRWDWRGYTGLSLTVRNPGKQTVQFGVRVDDDPRADGAQFCRQGWGSIEPGKSRTFVFSLASADPMSIGMRGLPNPRPEVQTITLTTLNLLRMEQIVAFQVFLHRPQQPTALVIDDIRLVAWLPTPESLRNIIDEFGQYTDATWKGKIRDVREFAQRVRAEQRDLQAHPPSPDFDEYGGWLKAPRLPATGYFRTEKVKGKWWLVTPNGSLFLSIGMDCVNFNEATMITGREHLFRWLPKGNEDPLWHHQSFASGVIRGPVKEGQVFNFYAANLQRKYGEQYRDRWREVTLQRLRSWGFNTIGAWSDWSSLRQGKIPYTVIVHIGGDHARVSSGIDYWGKMHDPFDPRFEQSVRQAIQPVAQQVANDPYCIGFFVDNELSWTGGHEEDGLYGLAFGALSEDASTSPAKRALLEQLRTRYPDISALNSAWGTHYESWDALAKPQRLTATTTSAQRQDLGAFVRSLADRYFSTVRRVLKEYAPNHLYLGARFAWAHPAIIQIASEHCDVLSFNIYAQSLDGWYPLLLQLDKPAIVGEFHFGALDSGMFHTGLVPANSQRHRAQMYRRYLYSVAEHPAFVGCHWFQYADQPTTGRWFDGENYNIGFVSITDTPYPELVATARKVNREVYPRRFGL